jgi:NADPH-dependent curcumin reductase CurA
VANYSNPVPLGSVMRGFGAGEIIASRHKDFAVGERLVGMFGWQSHALSCGDDVQHRVKGDAHKLSAYLGVLGVSGMTAYFGLLDVGRPKPGETVLVSTAAGAVGSAVGQIARLKGCRAIGIAGGPVKTAICRDEFGFDAALDYKAPDFEARLAEACGPGIDVYYDNTSGRISDAVLAHLNVGARVVICGTASVASWDPWPQGPRVERRLLVKRASMAGFLVTDHIARYGEAIAELSAWVKSGKLRYREDILDGIESAPDAIAGLYRGENLGRRVIRIDDA